MIDLTFGALNWLINHVAGLTLILAGAFLVSVYKFSVAGLLGIVLVLIGAGTIIFSFF